MERVSRPHEIGDIAGATEIPAERLPRITPADAFTPAVLSLKIIDSRLADRVAERLVVPIVKSR